MKDTTKAHNYGHKEFLTGLIDVLYAAADDMEALDKVLADDYRKLAHDITILLEKDS